MKTEKNSENPTKSSSLAFKLMLALIVCAGVAGIVLIISQMGGSEDKGKDRDQSSAVSSPDSEAPIGRQMRFYPAKNTPGRAGTPAPPAEEVEDTPEIRERARPLRTYRPTSRQEVLTFENNPEARARWEELLRIQWDQKPELWQHIPPGDRDEAFEKYRDKMLQKRAKGKKRKSLPPPAKPPER